MGLADTKLAPQQPFEQQRPVIVTFNYGSINGQNGYQSEVDIPSHEALVVGTSLGGRMSAVRRFFCLLTTFDLLFTLLIWFIAAMQTNTIRQAFINEVVEYNISSSLFDVVMVSAIRFTMIILAYALFRLAHWWVIALTTAGSGGFIICKVFFFNWQQSSQYITIILLICSFILSWGEAWFLDFRVVPYEDKASLLLARHINEQAPNIPSAPSSPTPPSDDECEFYSPLQSGDDSDCEINKPSEPLIVLSPEEIKYKQIAETALENALAIISSDNWRTEKVCGKDIVQSKNIPVYGKIFKFVGDLTISPLTLLEVMYNKNDSIVSWNPTVKEMKMLQKIDDNTDIVYVVAAEGGGGLVKSRDFVNARIWQKRGDTYILSMIATTHLSMPAQKHFIRGEHGPSAYVLMPAPGDSSKCQMQWLLNTNLKGWIPQYMIDQTISSVMVDYVNALRKYTSSTQQIT